MKIKLIILIAVIAVVLGLITYRSMIPGDPAPAASQGTSQENSQGSSQSLIADAKNIHRPAWLLFHSQTCASCIEMEKVYQALKPEFEGKVAFVNIDVNDSRENELLRQYQISYIPTTFLLDGNGEIQTQYVGVLSVDEMRGKLNDLLNVK